jgi:hypothetical protein
MEAKRRTAVVVGILFIVATVSSSLGFMIRDPLLEAPDYLGQLYPNRARVVLGVLLVLVNCAAVVAIPALSYPILAKHHQPLALLYQVARAVESAVIVVGEFSVLALLALSQEFVLAGAPADLSYQTVGAALRAAYQSGTHVIGVSIVFGLTALLLNGLLVRFRLVPRWISVWGLIGALLLLASGLVGLLGPSSGSTLVTLLPLPIAIQEMVFAVYLIARGFRPSARAARAT